MSEASIVAEGQETPAQPRVVANPSEAADPRRRILLSWGITILVILVLVGVIAVNGNRLYREAVSRAGSETRYLASIIEGHVGRGLGDAVIMINAVRQDIELSRRVSQLSATYPGEQLVVRSARLPQIAAALVLDQAGRVLHAAGTWPVSRSSHRNRPWFQQFENDQGNRLLIGPPIRFQGEAIPYLTVGQTISAPDGTFAGVILVLLDPAFFLDRLGLLEFAVAEGAAFISAGGQTLAYRPVTQPSGAGVSVPAPVFEATGPDDDSWIVARRTLPLGNLTVGAAIPLAGIREDWLARHIPEILVGGGSAVLLFLFNLFATIQLRRRGFAEKAHRRAEQVLAEGIESLRAGFTLFDSDDRLVMCNSTYREIYAGVDDLIAPGALFQDLIRAGVERSLFPGAAGDEEKWLAERIAGHLSPESLVEQELGNGHWLLIYERKTADGGTIGIRTDITELKQREAALDEARLNAEAASTAKSEFLAMMGHELRTPLNAIIGFSEIMSGEQLGPLNHPTYLEYTTDIRNSGRHLLAIINDILDLSKIEAGKYELQDSETVIEEMISSCLPFVGPQSIERKIAIHSRFETVDTVVVADEHALRKVIINLLGNAVKFTPPGGSVTVSTARGPEGDLAITVSDTGIGISEEQLPLVLEAFRQADSSLSREYEGTGLGLPIVDKLVKLHGGSLEIRSKEGEGTDVIVTLPGSRVLKGQERSEAKETIVAAGDDEAAT